MTRAEIELLARRNVWTAWNIGTDVRYLSKRRPCDDPSERPAQGRGPYAAISRAVALTAPDAQPLRMKVDGLEPL